MKRALILVLLLSAAFAADLLTTLDELDENIAEQIDQKMGEYAAETAMAVYNVNYKLLMVSPSDSADETSPLAQTVAGVVVSIAVLALTYYGLYYMFKASGANERNKAKAELQNMIVLVVLALTATSIFGMVMGIGTDLTDELGGEVTDGGWTEDNPLVAGTWAGSAEDVLSENPIVTLIYAFGLSISAISLALRWLFLDISRTLFPLFIALAFVPIDIVKGTGKILLKTMVVFIIVPFIDIALIGSVTSFMELINVASNPLAGLLALAFAFMMVGAINLLLPYMAVQISSLTQVNFMSLLSQVRTRTR